MEMILLKKSIFIIVFVIVLVTTNVVQAEPVTIIIGGIAFTAYEIGVIACTLGVAGYALVNGDDIQKAAMDFMTGCNHDTLVAIKDSLDTTKDGVINLTTEVWSTIENFVQNPRQVLWGVTYNPNIAVDFESAYVNFAHDSPVGYKTIKLYDSVFHFVETGEGSYYLYQDGLRPSNKITLNDEQFVFRDWIVRGDFGVYAKIVTDGEPMFYWYYDQTTNDIYLCINKVNKYSWESVFHTPVFTDVPITEVKPVEYQHHTIDVTGEDWYKTLTEGTVITAPTTFDGYTDLVGGVNNVDENVGLTFPDNPANVDSGTDVDTDIGVITDAGVDKLVEGFGSTTIDVRSIYDQILEKFNYTIFSETLKKMEKLRGASTTPPKIKINLYKILQTVQNIGHFDNPFPDEETTFIDFAILEELQFNGVSVSSWFRTLTSMGMVIMTFFHVKNKILPNNAMKG